MGYLGEALSPSKGWGWVELGGAGRTVQYSPIIMEYQRLINLLDNTTNQPSKFKTKQWVKINDESRETYNEDNQIRFKTSVLRSSLRVSSDAYILIVGTITVANTAAAVAANNLDKKLTFRNCALFTNCMKLVQ